VTVRTTFAAVLLAGAAGCASCDSVPPGAVQDCSAEIVAGGAATDILFVIDDSASMREEQDALSSNLGTFIDQLLGSAIALDVHLGVTNTSVEDYALTIGTSTGYGRLVGGFPGVEGTPYPQGTLVAIAQDPQGIGTAGHFLWGAQYDPAHVASTWGGPRILSSGASPAAALARDFRANVKQGVWGSSREQPLAAMRRALDKASCPGPNCGFLRAGARLAVVILTDEDDCSGPRDGVVSSDPRCHDPANWGRLDPLAEFVDYLDTTVGGPAGSKPIVAVIAGFDGAGRPTLCTGADATPPTATAAFSVPNRLNAFLDVVEPEPAAGARRTRTMKASICQEFGQTLVGLARMIVPQTMPLQQSPQDYRMMVVAVQKAAGVTQPCELQPAGAAGAASAGVIYTPAPPGGLPSLTFQNACTLGFGDKVDVRIVCAR
jgi:hypothetical protein